MSERASSYGNQIMEFAINPLVVEGFYPQFLPNKPIGLKALYCSGYSIDLLSSSKIGSQVFPFQKFLKFCNSSSPLLLFGCVRVPTKSVIKSFRFKELSTFCDLSSVLSLFGCVLVYKHDTFVVRRSRNPL